MISKVKDTIEKYNMIDGGDKIFAAVSGGADSVALLLVLKSIADELGFSLEAIHVEHGIRGKESEDDAKFVEDLCKRLGVRCHIYHIDAPSFAGERGYSLEEAARILRYECFDKHTTDGKVAIAHNMDDNAETMLYNMVRGTGIEGIRGIKKVRDNFIRPLIECTRYEIEKFLEAEGRDFRTDSTNEQTDYTRNKIRHNVMPVLL
ncbi:MAG: tRNA lysidine(34) synthetase TilS, partial [Lachnospiraceae bacterium]|nr:tRNA lysidine(34) synthetase TilS [Lachnospiraceae bacterium]